MTKQHSKSKVTPISEWRGWKPLHSKSEQPNELDSELDILVNQIEWSVQVPGSPYIDRSQQEIAKAQFKKVLAHYCQRREIEAQREEASYWNSLILDGLGDLKDIQDAIKPFVSRANKRLAQLSTKEDK